MSKRRKTLIYIGEESYPEILERKQFETKHDYIIRVITHLWVTIGQLWEHELWTHGWIRISGHLAKPIISLLDKFLKQLGKDLKSGKTAQILEGKTQEDYQKVETFIYGILARGEKSA